jgi:acetylornithine/succinyldiaminopimelate/putrescine aminotransferase
MTDTQNIIDETFKNLIKTYAPQPVVMDRGEGVYAWDTDGKKYLDCAAGIAVASLGHAHPAMLKTINEQAAFDGRTGILYYKRKAKSRLYPD